MLEKRENPEKKITVVTKTKSSCVPGAGAGASARLGGGQDGVGVITWLFVVSKISVGSVMY